MVPNFEYGGGGLCGANAAAVHCHGYEKMSRALRRNINIHKLSLWDYYKMEFTFPLTEMVGVQEMTFLSEETFLAFLRDDSRSDLIWTRHSDLQAISNMYRIKINIFTTGVPVPGAYGDFARWTQLSPDLRLADKAEYSVEGGGHVPLPQ